MRPRTETGEPAVPLSMKTISTACFVSLLAFWGLLSGAGLWPSWSEMAGQTDELLPVVFPHRAGGMNAPPASPSVRAVTIPVEAFVGPAPPLATPPLAGGHTAVASAPEPRMPRDPLPAVLRTPAGAGPFPAVILLHDCNGPFTGVPDWAYRLNAWGYAVLMPDSMTPRGVRSVCGPDEQPMVTPRDRVGDVGASLAWLRARPEIDPERIAVLGLSHGGVAAMLATQSAYAGMGLRAAVDYHGPCQEPRLHGSVPLLVLAGEADDWGDPAARCRAYGSAIGPGQPFEIHTYPGVYHAFDGGPASRTVSAGHMVAYDKAAAEDSFSRVRTFLARDMGAEAAH